MAAGTRPLTLGEILDRTVELYRRSFLLFAGISTLPAAVMVLATGGIALLLSSQLPALKSSGDQGAILIAILVVLALLVGVPLMLAAFSLSLGASNYAVLNVHHGEKVTIRASYGYAFRHFWRHVGILLMQVLLAWIVPYMIFTAILVVGSIVGALIAKSGASSAGSSILIFLFVVLIVALLVACLTIWVRYSLAFAATVAEDKKVWPSMQRSSQVTKGSRWRIFVMFLMVGVLSMTISAALLIPITILLTVIFSKEMSAPSPPPMFLILFETANLSVSFLVRAFVTPIYSIALLLFYYDQRTRNEGYDIEQLMAKAGWTEIPPPAPPPVFVPVQPPPPPPAHPPVVSPEAPIPPPLPAARGEAIAETAPSELPGTIKLPSIDAEISSAHLQAHPDEDRLPPSESGMMQIPEEATREAGA